MLIGEKTVCSILIKRKFIISFKKHIIKGLVNPVQDQGKFSNSYAYSACAAIEAMHFMKTEKLVKCSEQNIIDGSKSHGNHG